MDQFQALCAELGRRCPELELRIDEPMSRHTSFRIGGPAALMALPVSEDQAVTAVKAAAELGIVPFFMGNGSNLLVADAGVRRFFLKSLSGLGHWRVEGNQIQAGSGATLTKLAIAARDNSLEGMEFAHGIPGTLGGAIAMNAGAYGGEMAQVVVSAVCLTAKGEPEVVTDFSFGYRHSAFSGGERMLLSATLQLRPGKADMINARMEELSASRRAKQPLEYPSAGSMFKRPPGHFAAALIDRCGLKGFSVGAAQVSEKHAGFVINRGQATCAHVLELVDEIRRRVFEQTGIELEPEVKFLQ